MKKKRAAKQVNRELVYVFDKSPFINLPSKFEVEEQHFVINNHYGTLECCYDARAAARQIDSILFSQFLERHESEFNAIELRHTGEADFYKKDDKSKALLALREEERKKCVPVALKLLSEQLQASLETALKNTVNRVAVRAIKQLEEHTGIHKAASAEELSDLLLHQVEDETKEQLPTRERRRPQKWNRAMLYSAVRKTIADTPKSRLPTLKSLAKLLNSRHRPSPTLNADAVGKLLEHYRVDWKNERKQR